MNQTQLPATDREEAEEQAEPTGTPESPAIGAILKTLRGKRSLRQVHAETGVPYTYLSSIELGQKNPGIKTLSRLAECYNVPLHGLLQAAGRPEMKLLWSNPSASTETLEFILKALREGNYTVLDDDGIREANIQRSYKFVMADPDLSGCRKPEETPPVEFQQFVVEMYQHYTGKTLL